MIKLAVSFEDHALLERLQRLLAPYIVRASRPTKGSKSRYAKIYFWLDFDHQNPLNAYNANRSTCNTPCDMVE